MGTRASEVTGFLDRCRRRLVLVEAAAGLSYLVGALVLAVLILFGFGALGDPTRIRLVIRVALLLVAIATLTFYGFRPWRHFSHRSGVAREIERRRTRQDLLLVSALQLEDALRRNAGEEIGSPDLIHAHLEQVRAEVAGWEIGRLIPLRRLLRPTLLLLTTLTGAAVAAGLSPGPFQSAWAALLGPGPVNGIVDNGGPPWIGDIQLTYRYPAYSGRPDRVVEGTDGTVLALPGTRVAITSRADRDLGKATLRLEDGVVPAGAAAAETAEPALPLAIEGGRRLAGELLVMSAGGYRFELEDAQGERWRDPRPHPIHLEVDRAPEIGLQKPTTDLVVSEKDAIDLQYDARDDYGLQEIRLVWRVVGRAQGESRRALQQFANASQRASRGALRWELAPLRLEPGDQVQFALEATDGDTVRGPKVGRSASFNLKVFSEDEQHRDLLTRAQALWEKLLAALAGSLELDPEAKPQTPLDRKSALKVQNDAETFLAESGRLIADLSKDRRAFRPLIAALTNIAGALDSLQAELSRLLVREPADAAAIDKLLAAHQKRRVARYERDVLYLEDLLDLVRLDDLDRLAQDLAAAERRLAELMQRYREAPSDEVRRQIEQEIARLKDKIAKLLARQGEVLKEIRDEYLNPEALAKLASQRDLMGSLDQLQKLMMEGKTDEALAELAKLQKQLQALQSAIERSKGGYAQNKYQELGRELAQIQGDLGGITEEQRRILEGTEQSRNKLLEQLKRQNEKHLKALFAKLRKRAAAVQKDLAALPTEQPDPFSSRFHEQAAQQARLLQMALESMDVVGALDAAEDLHDSTRVLRQEIQVAGQLRGGAEKNKREDWERRALSAERGSEEIAQALRQILPDPEKLLGKGEADRLRKLSGRQAELRGRLRQLGQRLQKINEKVPLFGPEAQGRLSRGGSAMDCSASQLGQKNPGKAFPHQQDAMAELEALKKGLEQSCKGGGGGMPLPMGGASESGQGEDDGSPGGNPEDRRVELPGPDDYKPPEAFRKDLLEGMKDPVPEGFLQQVRRYYEELVK